MFAILYYVTVTLFNKKTGITTQNRKENLEKCLTWNDEESSTHTDIPRNLQSCQQQPGSMEQHYLNTELSAAAREHVAA